MIKCVKRIVKDITETNVSFWLRAVEAKEKIAETSQTEVRLIFNNEKGIAVVYQRVPKEAR